MQRLLIDQADITRTQLDEVPSVALEDGQVRLKLRHAALTANNVTYAATGFIIGYWKFFPSGIDGQGILPVWGFADVVETTSDLAIGTRLYGFFPLAEELIISPKEQGAGLILDKTPHRRELPIIYNQYVVAQDRPIEMERLQALLQPLLATSFLLSDWLKDNEFFDAEQIIIGSASSKTGLGLCKFLFAMEKKPVRVIGLTSAANLAFVNDVGACDDVLSYEQIDQIAQRPSVYVDMSGNADVRARLHSHLADVLKHSSAVGTSHWDKFQPQQLLAGPKPQFFFAPSQVEKRRAEWGAGVIERQIHTGWRGIAAGADEWLNVQTHAGLDSAAQVYDDLARGASSPRDGHIITLG